MRAYPPDSPRQTRSLFPPPRGLHRIAAYSTCILLTALASACGAGAASQDASYDGMDAAGDEATAQARTPPRGHAWVIFGSDTVVAEVARTPEERQQGLMYREELAEGRGMLFVFDRPEVRSFWMQNTYIALDIAYMDEGKRIMNILAMEPLSNDLYESTGPALFALEVPQGWFEAMGIREGDRAEIIFGP